MATVKYLYVYILRCADNTYYTGSTNNPEQRLSEHNRRINPKSYTLSRRPLELVYCERFSDYDLVINREKKIKDWSRKKKEALITENWEKLKQYAICRNEKSHTNKEHETLPDSARSDRMLEI